jgi:hypothetical protein
MNCHKGTGVEQILIKTEATGKITRNFKLGTSALYIA